MDKDYVGLILQKEFDKKINIKDAILDSMPISLSMFILCILGQVLFFLTLPKKLNVFIPVVVFLTLFIFSFLFSVIAQKLGRPYYEPRKYNHNCIKLLKMVEEMKKRDELLKIH